MTFCRKTGSSFNAGVRLSPFISSLRNLFLLLFFAFSLGFGSPEPFALSKPFDHSSWDRFLKKFVNEEGEVNYRGVKEDPSLLNEYLAKLAGLGPEGVFGWPREEKLALWLNGYHAAVVRAVIENYPVKSIKDIPSVWETQRITVGINRMSLQDIQAVQLIGATHDEKIYTALCCGARSCPKMRREAYTGTRVEGQLFLAAREFVNDPARNRVIPGKKKAEISRIFKWHAADFKLDFGTFENDRGLSQEEHAVLSFIAHYLQDAGKLEFLEQGNYKIKYLPFDWSLNEWHPETGNDSSAPPASR